MNTESERAHEYLDVVVRALEKIESNLFSDYGARDLASEFERSHWHFQRLFKCVVGVPVSQFMRRRRLTEGARLLRSTDSKIVDVALSLGFGSHEAFSRSFKTEFGIGPLEYRKTADYVLTNLVDQIHREKLEFFWNDVQRSPEIVEIPERNLVGVVTEYRSHFLEGSDCARKVVAQWQAFLRSHEPINGSRSSRFFGVAMSSESELLNERLTYLSAVESVDPARAVPAGMISFQLPKGTYARFRNRGADQKRSLLIDYVYGIWLPSSGRPRRVGFDFEEFDSAYRIGDDSSISHFYVPID